jgi:hypothetical protein
MNNNLVKSVESINEVINPNNANAMTKDLRKQLSKEEKALNYLINKKMGEAVINAQKQIVERLKQTISETESNEQVSVAILKDEVITFQLAKDGSEISKKVALVNHNRTINSKKVDKFIAIIANEEYEDAYPIIVMEAKELIKNGYTVTDINGRELSEDEAEGYFVILDGQHRTMAFAKLNAAKGGMVIPNVHVKENIDNVGKYLNDINTVGNWDKGDRITVAALTSKDELFENMAALIKEGFNPTTAGLIYTKKNISEKVIAKVLNGEEYKLPKDTVVDIKRGNNFITLCKAAHITVPFLTKRYFIKGFNSYAKATSESQAFDALTKLKALNLNEASLKLIKEDDDFLEKLKEALEA